MPMQENKIIEYEWGIGRSDEEVVRRLYSVELPIAFEAEREILFEILHVCSQTIGVSVLDIKIAGSAQTGYSFHGEKAFDPKSSDLDLAIINKEYFEKVLRAVRNVALPEPSSAARPRQNVFPLIKGQSVYNRFLENAALYGLILPHHIPNCSLKNSIFNLASRLSSANSGRFKNISLAFYVSQFFFERKQQSNIGLYRHGRKGG